MQIFVVVHEVDIGRVHDEQVAGCVMKEEVLVCGRQLLDIGIADIALSGDAFAFQALLENFRRGLQIDHQIWCRDLIAEHLVVTVIKRQFRIAQVHISEELVLLEDVIGNNRIAEVFYVPHLLVAFHEKPHLRRKGHAGLGLIKAVQKGIIFRLDNSLSMQCFCQDLSERRFSDPDRSFYSDKAGLFKKLCHHDFKKFPERRKDEDITLRLPFPPSAFPDRQQATLDPMLATLATAGAAATLAAGGYAYAAMWPTSQIFGKAIIGGRDPREFALTYDDGPNDPYTQQLLDVLATHNVRATFFLIGRFVRQRPEIARAIHAAGHLVGNHTMTHPVLLFQSPKRVREELADCKAAIEDALGEPVRYFRPPHGARRPDVLRAARDLGLSPVLWNAMGYDWRPTTAEAVLANLQKGIRRNQQHGQGSNLLLHDGGQAGIGEDRSHSVAATARLLESTKQQIRYVTIDTWKI